MFGGGSSSSSTTTIPFGQSSSGSSPFGSKSAFGQTGNANAAAANNPFAPKPFGTTAPFGSQTGSGTSLFGGTSTGVFGAALTSSPFASITSFNASSSPALFGASSSAPAFATSSSFGGSSMFGQKPVFGGFGSSTQTSRFGSTSQQSQPRFGSSLFGSTTPFRVSSHSAFGVSSSPVFSSTSTTAFGESSASAFGANSTPAFGAASTPAFGATTGQAFGATATPVFGSSGTAFAASSTTPLFGSGAAFRASNSSFLGSSSTSAFGSLSSPAFSVSSTSAFGPSSSSAFGACSTPASGASSTPSFSFASSPAFSQSTSAFGSSYFGTNASLFDGQSSPFGTPVTTPASGSPGFAYPAFRAQGSGSRVKPYTVTTETESTGGQGEPGKFKSVSAMPDYREKSHEELRWEDYRLGDKGGPHPRDQSPGGFGFTTSAVPSNPFTTRPSFSQASITQFSASTKNFNPLAANSTARAVSSSNPFTTQPPFSQSSATQFSASTTNLNPLAAKYTAFTFSTTPALNISPFDTSSTSFPSTSFGPTRSSSVRDTTSATAAFGPAASPFCSSCGPATALPLSGINNTQQPTFSSSTTPPFSQTGSTFFHETTSSFQPTSFLSTPSTGISGGILSGTPSLVPSSTPTFSQTTSSAFQQTRSSQSGGPCAFSTICPGQPAAVGTTGFAGVSLDLRQTNPGKPSATQSSVGVQPTPMTSPFGTLPVMPQMSIFRAGTSPLVQYGISSMPVVDKPAPVRISSLLTSRHLSQRRIRLPAKKFYPKHDAAKVPFFSDEEETPSTLKANALLIPRENPRTLVICPTDLLTLRASIEKMCPLKDPSPSILRNENPVGNGIVKEQTHNVKFNQKPNEVQEDHSIQKEESYLTISGHRAGEAAIVYEHGADIEAQMPKLCHSDYYTEPRIQELAAKERVEPGFCCHVKDFVVGRHGYGSIKFVGETDVRRLDLGSLVHFNNREVIVYMDDSKKPPLGQGLNKPAEVTLLNIKCFDKKTGRQYTEGLKIEKYKEMLKKKAEGQGAEFVSYDPVKGEWKFKVSHFSKYRLGDDEELNWDAQFAGVC